MNRRRRGSIASPVGGGLLLLLILGGVPAWARTVSLDAAHRVAIAGDLTLTLQARPRSGEAAVTFARRYTGREDGWKEIRRANRNVRRLYANRSYRIPLDLLTPKWRHRVLTGIFPDDAPVPGGWRHVVAMKRLGLPRGETLWKVAEWFTGRGRNYRRIIEASKLDSATIYTGQELFIPNEVLLPVFRGPAPPPDPGPVTEPIRPLSENGAAAELTYGRDPQGPFAVYKLQAGEALYSAVVVRFTGRVDADEVNSLAMEIARRSGIRDVTDIPIGYPVKIPLEALSLEFLPREDPRRIKYESEQRELARAGLPTATSRDLKGVVVILDAGHGGRDPGAMARGVWEDDYVYDIVCRVKRRLDRTAAQVFLTIKDQETGYAPQEKTKLPWTTKEYLLTTPRYLYTNVNERKVQVNLRWFLSNDHYRRLRKSGVPRDRFIFTSFHADSLHPSLTGSMVYIPGMAYRNRPIQSYGSRPYRKFAEVRRQPRVRLSYKQRKQSEALSRTLANKIVRTWKDQGLGLHRYKPVRTHVVRGGGAWTPAVLRYNQVPTSLLLEVCNLNSRRDRERIRDPKFREQIAAAYVEALKRHFS